jgi:AraC-like DNA-binding protein
MVDSAAMRVVVIGHSWSPKLSNAAIDSPKARIAGNVYKSGLKRFGAVPSSAGTLSRYAYDRARAAGIDVAPLMVKAGVTRPQVEADSIRVTVPGQIKFVELVADELHDHLLGFHLAQSFDLREMGFLYYVPASSETIGDALRRFERYVAIANEGVAVCVREGKDLTVTFHYVGVERFSDRHQIESFVTFLVRLCRQLTNRHLIPSGVSLCHRREKGRSELDRFLGCNVLFGADVDEVAFPRTATTMPVVSVDPVLNKLLIKYAEETHSYQKYVGAFQVDLANTIASLLPHGKAREGEIARRLGMSPRTLARRLASEGLTFSRVLAELRADLSARYLNDEDLTVSQVAWLLGYQEVSGFTHAFKRWTGKTPREARAQKHTAPGEKSEGRPRKVASVS